ncbi:MAG: hypothetical protein AB1716_15180 [Planctomycetota bacterium]
MNRLVCLGWAVIGLALLPGGCPGNADSESALRLLDVNSGQAVLQYYNAWNGWETLPSSIWLADLAEGTTRRVEPALVQYGLQAAGDFYIAERPADDGARSRVVAGQFSTGDEWTVVTRDEALGGRYFPAAALDGERVVVRVPAGLLIYGLSSRTARQTVPLTEPAVELLAAKGSQALVSFSSSYTAYALVNLADGELTELPDAAEGYTPRYANAFVSDSELIAPAFVPEGETTVRQAVLRLDLATSTWETLFDYGPGPSETRVVGLFGVDDEGALVFVAEGPWDWTLELLARDGGRAIVARLVLSDWPATAVLRDGRISWLSHSQRAVMTYEVGTAKTTVQTLEKLPGE